MNLFRLSDGRCIDVNNAFLSLTGYSRDEFLNHTAAELNLLVTPATRDVWMKEIQECGSTHPRDIPIRQKSGDIREIIGSLELVEVEGEKLILVMATGVTERKQAESRLRANQKMLQDISDNSTTLIYTLDKEGRFTLINKRLEAVLGVPAKTMIGKPREAALPAEIAAAHRANDVKVIETHEPLTITEENEEQDGTHFYLTTKFPLFNHKGNITGVGAFLPTSPSKDARSENLR